MMPSSAIPERTSDQRNSGHGTIPACFRLAVLTAPNDRDAALKIAQETLGLNAIDARTRIRHVPAVWPDEFSEEAAQQAAQELQQLGTTAAAVRARDVPDLSTARLLHHARCADDGFVLVSIAGEREQTIAWENVSLLSLAYVAGLRQVSAGRLPDGVFRHVLGIAQFAADDEKPGLEMWLVCESPFAAYRIDAELMNHEYLGQRLTNAIEENLRRLVEDIRRFAPRVILTPSAQAYVSEPPRALLQLRSATAHRQAVLAHWVILRGTRTAGQNAPPTQPRQRAADSTPLPWDNRLYQAHVRLSEQIGALRASCHDHVGNDATERLSLRRQLEQLRKTTEEHFALEEEGGDMTSVLDIAPRYSQLVDALRQQHDSLRDQARRLSEQPDCRAAAIRDFIETLEAHEHAENAVVQSAFSDDLAAGD
jgi:hypothetical protein